ncbi:MAG: hypothetical protein WA432_02380 [Candidatus Babeliaceae bacterium]
MPDALIVLIYDSIENSVFESQVLIPLQLHYAHKKLMVISFERIIPKKSAEFLQKKYPHIHFIFFKRFPFIVPFFLYYDVWRVKHFLRRFKAYELRARGPLAGFIAGKLARGKKCVACLIQIRGLLAQEYVYTHAQKMHTLHIMRTKMFERLERKAYSIQCKKVLFEAVSPALKEYVVHAFGAIAEKIFVARLDIPSAISPEMRQVWRQPIRASLGIAYNTTIYCYNGSAKAWQCPELVIDFFIKKYAENAHSFLLVLTQEVHIFETLLQSYKVPKHVFHVRQVAHDEIYAYLAASDVGLIFRKQHVVNWVSRPTKLLEYQAVGLAIEHNNTIAWLAQQSTQDKIQSADN